MNEMKIFSDPGFGAIRTIEQNGKVYFCGCDVANALGYAIPSKAVNTHCKGVTKMEVPTNGGLQKMLFISESDLYRLICNSKLPAAEKFERWVFDEVLPMIRQQGSYNATDIKDIIALTVSETVKQLLPYITNHTEKRALCEYTEITLPIAPKYKVETFPPEIQAAIDSTLELMSMQNRLNFSAVARWCTNNGYPIAYNTIQRYYDAYFVNGKRQ